MNRWRNGRGGLAIAAAAALLVPHEIDPPQGYFDSWNNKPVPQFSASDSEYGYGPVYRVQMLTAQIQRQFALHGGRITRAELVQATETAATQDLDGLTILPQLLAAVSGRPEPAGVAQMLAVLKRWYASGAHRALASASAPQYEQADAVAIMDQLTPTLIRSFFDRVLAASGASQSGYGAVPMSFVNEPYNGGSHLGSAYDGGWEGYMVRVLEQYRHVAVGDPFGAAVTRRVCRGGLATCGASIDTALAATYRALVGANGGSTTVSSWTADRASLAAHLSMPNYDDIAFRGIGIVGQPNIPWQNRPTSQQVVSFPSHRPR